MKNPIFHVYIKQKEPIQLSNRNVSRNCSAEKKPKKIDFQIRYHNIQNRSVLSFLY